MLYKNVLDAVAHNEAISVLLTDFTGLFELNGRSSRYGDTATGFRFSEGFKARLLPMQLWLSEGKPSQP
jgi:hypothetical protein